MRVAGFKLVFALRAVSMSKRWCVAYSAVLVREFLSPFRESRYPLTGKRAGTTSTARTVGTANTVKAGVVPARLPFENPPRPARKPCCHLYLAESQ